MIDEKKLIEDIWGIFNSTYNDAHRFGKKETELAKRILCDVQNVIESYPKADNWILCSERLPKDGVDVLVWFEYFRYGDYNRLFQTKGISYMFDEKWSGFVNGSCGWDELRIIAWQPLPQDYDPPTEELIR